MTGDQKVLTDMEQPEDIKEELKETIEAPTEPPKPAFTKIQLDEAFQHLQDVMDRILCPYVILDETLRSIKEDDELKGDGITIGIRVQDYNESTQSMLRTLSANIDLHLGIENYSNDGKSIYWEFKDVPIRVKVIHNSYPFINNPDFIFYMGEDLKMPNPFEEYWAKREEMV